MTAPDNFAAFILSHGRPNKVDTFRTLRVCGYTGPIYIIVDNLDKTVPEYINIYSQDQVVVFDKKAVAEKTDACNNFNELGSVIYARNACFDIAKQLAVKYFIMLDDDYGSLYYRFGNKGILIRKLNEVFAAFLDFYKNTNILSIAIAQGGDFIGGPPQRNGAVLVYLWRKCMNSFFCSTERPFRFIGVLNDDVNTYTLLGSRGELFFTYTGIQVNQKQTQTNSGGLTDIYLKYGTYHKSFTTVMLHPSSVKVSMLTCKNKRLHHLTSWEHTVPQIIPEHYKKKDKTLERPPFLLD